MCLSVERNAQQRGNSKTMNACNIHYPKDFDDFVYFRAIMMSNRTIFSSIGEKYTKSYHENIMTF